MVIFGFGNEGEFSRDDFHFFLDCLFRGFLKLLIVSHNLPPHTSEPISLWTRRKQIPLYPRRNLSPVDLEKLVSQIFPNNIDIVERSDFIELMSHSKEICKLMKYIHERCLGQVGFYRSKILERIQVTQSIRRLLLEVQKNV